LRRVRHGTSRAKPVDLCGTEGRAAHAAAGAIFGELAALGLNTERTMTIRALTNAVVYSLSADAIGVVLKDQPEVRGQHDYLKLLLLRFLSLS
jgi:CRP-like cAMP-binding protein